MSKPNRAVVLWDIDGVLADDRVRAESFLAAKDQFAEPRSLALRPAPDWIGYYGAMSEDEPHHDMIGIFKALHFHNSGLPTHFGRGLAEAMPVFITGREEKYRFTTAEWLRRYVHPFADYDDVAPLIMRKAGSRLTNADEKAEHLEYIREHFGVPRMAFEDNDATVALYRSLGIRCLQPTRAVPSGLEYRV